jgi:hypothetical protein
VYTHFQKLRTYCEEEQFKGWDPFDGLNSRIFQGLSLVKQSSSVRLLWIQLFKKSPVNLRKILLVDKGYNPKGLALFLNGYCNLYKTMPDAACLEKINILAQKIISLKSDGYSGACWGYNFDWQAKAFLQPKYTPTVVVSTFAGYALLDAYEITGNEEYKENALSISDFITRDLNRTGNLKGDFAFSYSPKDNTQVFNASLLGSRMLARIYHYTKNDKLLELAKKSIVFCCGYQKSDGSWSYGTLPYHQWTDSFHTGYNLECIYEYQKYSNDYSFQANVRNGCQYYLKTFFTKDGIPKYYNNSVYPIDIHSSAQLVITLFRLGQLLDNINMVNRTLSWTFDHMQHKKGYFYYQRKRNLTIKIPYMRWSQAWMFYALATYLSALSKKPFL